MLTLVVHKGITGFYSLPACLPGVLELTKMIKINSK
jgi:hypothetical protein